MSLTPDCVSFIDNPPSGDGYGDCCCSLAILKVIYATLRHVHNSIVRVRIIIPIVTMNVQMVTLDAASGLYPHCSLLLTTATIHHLLGSDSSESLFEVILATLFLPRDLTVVVVVVSPRLGWGREDDQICSYPIDAMSAAWHSLHSSLSLSLSLSSRAISGINGLDNYRAAVSERDPRCEQLEKGACG